MITKKDVLEIIALVLFTVFCLTAGYLGGRAKENQKIIKLDNLVVVATDTKKVILKNGLKIENKKFNVGDTLVIIKK